MIIQINPQHAAVTKIALGNVKGAISDFDALVRVSPESAEAYHKRGQAKEALGQHEAAKADFQKAKA